MAPSIEHYLCIGCPLGCRLEVEADEEGDIVEVRGFDCKRGKDYAHQEHTAPQRMVTTTVRVQGGQWARLPVKTREAVDKSLIQDVVQQVQVLTIQAPVEMGDIILENVLESGVDIIATRNMIKD